MFDLNVPQGYVEKAQQIMSAVSIPVTEETFHDTLMSLVGAIRNGAKDGLSVNVFTFDKDGSRSRELFMPENTAIKLSLEQENTVLLISDKNGAVFCLNYVKVGDKEYLQFLNPETARTLANEERQMLSMHQEPEELSFFQKLCDAISRLILRHPTEAAARREAYRAFYENMQKNIDQLDQVSRSRPAEEYEVVRNRQIRDQREAERLAEEERMRLEQEALEKAEQERLAAEEKARLEREKAERKAQFENLDQPEPAYEVSQAVLDEEAFMEETNKKSDEDLVRIQIQTLQDKISLAEISLKQLPTMRTVYDRQIKEGEENLKIIKETLENNKSHEKKLSEKIQQLTKQIDEDSFEYSDLNGRIEDMITQHNLDTYLLEEDKKPVDKAKEELDAAQARFDEINEGWEAVEQEHSLLMMDPKDYLKYMYQLSKTTRETRFQHEQQEMDQQIEQQELTIKAYKVQMRQIKSNLGKSGKEQLLGVEENLKKAEAEFKELKQKRDHSKKDFEEMEKEHKKEFLSPTQEKLEETKQFMQDSLEEYNVKRDAHDTARNALDLTKTAYQNLLTSYQQKQEMHNAKWNMLEQEQKVLEEERSVVKARWEKAENDLAAMKKVYEPLKKENEKGDWNLKAQTENLRAIKQVRANYDRDEVKWNEQIREAKEELQKLGVLPEGEQKKVEGPVVGGL